jgi:Fic family protein
MDWESFSFDFRLEAQALGPVWSELISIEASKEAASNLVLPQDWREQLDRLNRVRAVYGTTALEGNPLSEAAVSEQMDLISRPKQVPEERATKEQLQIRNAGMAQNWVRLRFQPENPPLRLDDIRRMHQMMTRGSDENNNDPGKFRPFSVVVGSADMGGVHRGAPYEDVPRLMDEYVEFINSRKLVAYYPVIRALLAHFFLVTIHPFGDGNGRVSRLVEAAILFQNDHNVLGFYGLSNYFYRNEGEYKTLLQECRRKQPFDVTPFVSFGLRGFAVELKGINQFIKTKLNRVVYRGTLVRAFNTKTGERRRVLNQREYSLLDFLLTETEPLDPFSQNPSRQIKLSELQRVPFIKSAYRDLTTRTFHRELSRLDELGFIRFKRNEIAGESIVELDFGAIGRY